MTQGPRPPRLGLVLLVGLSFAWGGNWPFMKIALAEIPVWTFRAWSCIAAGLLLLSLARATGGRLRPAPGETTRLFIAALFNVTLWHILVGYSTIIMVSGHAAVLGFTMPLWAALISVTVLGERPTARVFAALALGLGGIAALLSRDLHAVGDSPLGAAMMLVAACGWAVGTLYLKRQRWTLDALAMAGWQLALGCIPIFAVLPFVEGFHVPQASWAAWASSAYVTLVALVFAYVAWFRIVGLFPANVAAIGTLLTPVVAVVSGALVLGEPLGWREAAALALIGGALALVLIAPAMHARPVVASAD